MNSLHLRDIMPINAGHGVLATENIVPATELVHELIADMIRLTACSSSTRHNAFKRPYGAKRSTSTES